MRIFLLSSLLAAAVFAGQSAGVSARVLVTAESTKGHETPALSSGDVSVRQSGEKEARPVEEWVALKGDRAGLQLAIMIDDGSDSDLSLQFGDLRKFMEAQPATTQFGIYYMRNGGALPAQPFTANRELTSKALRLPLSQPGIAASPYDALEDLIAKWPATEDRREVLMISSGIDLYRGSPSQNPYLAAAIDKAQRAMVAVHSIYYPGAGHLGHDAFHINFGRDNLSLLGDDTGGEAYWQGIAAQVSIKPYLDDLSGRLNHQYYLTFSAKPEAKAGLRQIKLHTEVPHLELMGPAQVWVPASR